jgi:hypothetical protein
LDAARLGLHKRSRRRRLGVQCPQPVSAAMLLLLLLSIASFLNRKQPVWLHVRAAALSLCLH